MGFYFGFFAYMCIIALIAACYMELKHPRPHANNRVHIIHHGGREYREEPPYISDPVRNLGATQRNLDRYKDRMKRQSDRIDMFDNWGYLSKKKKKEDKF